MSRKRTKSELKAIHAKQHYIYADVPKAGEYKPFTTKADRDRLVKERFAELDAENGKKLKGVIVYDNGGETADRYTVIVPDGSVYGMSSNPSSSQGFNQYSGEKSEFPNGLSHTGKKVDVSKLPEGVQKAIINRMEDD